MQQFTGRAKMQGTDLDYIIQNGLIIDGSGTRPPFRADVGIAGDRIAAIGTLAANRARVVIDAQGRMVSPGFIDVHVHSELALLGGRDRFAGLRQGVTTHLMSPDGFGWAPLDAAAAEEMWHYTRFAYGEVALSPGWPTVRDYLSLFDGRLPANVYPQVPHGAVRLRVMGWDPRPATQREIAKMVDVVAEWMDAGAGAFSAGLDYQPGIHADRAELVALARAAGSHGGPYAAHIRKGMLGRAGAWKEMVAVARESEVPVHLSHERVDGETEALLGEVERAGIDLTFDSYLYPAGMTHLAILLPQQIQAGSLQSMLQRMRDPGVRQSAISHLRQELGALGNQIVGYTDSGRFVGLTLAEAAEGEGKPWAEFAYDLILEEAGVETFTLPWLVSQAEGDRILRQTAAHPRLMIASDGIYNVPHPHPRAYGCFAQVLRRYVRELKLLTLEQAVHKMSGFAASRFGLRDRGRIAEGMAADLVILNADTVADHATWKEPLRPASGVEWVIVNGEIVIERGTLTGRLPGRVLRRSN